MHHTQTYKEKRAADGRKILAKPSIRTDPHYAPGYIGYDSCSLHVKVTGED